MNLMTSMILVAAVTGGDALQEADSLFRIQVLEIMPDDYGTVIAGTVMEDAATIAGGIYSEHSDEIADIAMKLTSSMLPAQPGLLDGLAPRDSLDLEPMLILGFLGENDSIPIDGYLYLMRFWDPTVAAAFSKSVFLAWSLPTSEYSGRVMAERILPDQYYLLDEEPQRPVLAAVSLDDVFIIELELQESGCYLPTRLFWYE
jgi:hypothetical protein